MALLSPYARLVRLTDDTVLATTASLVSFSVERVMDAAGARSITVPLGDAGAATTDPGSFVGCALAATGGADATSAPVPTLCELSLDGGSTIDARFVIEQTAPDLSSSGAVLHISGHSPAVLYGASGPDRVPVTDVALVDVLGGNPSSLAAGTVVPVSATHYGISTSGVIPSLRGLLVGTPGDEPASGGGTLWDAAARARFAVTAVLTPALSDAVAFLGVNIDAWEDTTLRLITSIVSLLGGVFFSGDSAEQGSRGHAVWCDADLNLASDIAGVVADGTPSIAGGAAGAHGYSNDVATRGGSGASASATISGGHITAITSGGGGSLYVVPPLVTITGDGTGAAAVAFLAGDAVHHYVVMDAGAGYTTASVTLTSRPAVPNALVVGNVGGTPRGVAFTFNGTSSLPLAPAAETTTARIQTDQTRLVPDLAPLVREVRLTGGTSDAGLPPGATIAAIVTLQNTPIEGAAPFFSWHNVLPVVAANQGSGASATGGLYVDVGDSSLRPVPSYTLSLPITDICVDNSAGVMYLSTNQGVWSHSTTNLLTSTTPWVPVGGLSADIKRLMFTGAVLIALVSGVDDKHDGIYQYNVTTPSSAVGTGYDHWTRISSKPGLIDALATDSTSFFFLDAKADSGAALWYHDGTTPATPLHHWTLGTGVQGTRLDRVILASGGGQDSVWVSCSGGTQAARYLVHGTDWVSSSLLDADHDGSLATAVGTQTGGAAAPQVNRAVPLGYAINSVDVAVVLCTQAGLYFMPGTTLPTTLGGVNWSQALCGMNGVGGISITHLVAGQQTSVPDPYNPAGHVQAARMYAIGGSALYYSYSDARYWRDRLRDPLSLAPIFFALCQSVLSDLPDWGVQTVGPMASSPIGGPTGSHVQVAGVFPAGWWLQRHYGGPTLEPYYGLVNGAVPWPTVYTEQVSEVAVTPTVGLQAASAQVLAFALVLLGEHSRTATTLTVVSTFSQQDAGLRYLWPTHAVAVSQTGAIPSISESGDYIRTTYLDLVAAPFYVQSHTITGDGPLVTTTTTLASSVRGTPKTGSELAAALVTDLRRIRVAHRNRGH